MESAYESVCLTAPFTLDSLDLVGPHQVNRDGADEDEEEQMGGGRPGRKHRCH